RRRRERPPRLRLPGLRAGGAGQRLTRAGERRGGKLRPCYTSARKESSTMSRTIGCVIALVAVAVIFGLVISGQYNGLVSAEQTVEESWSQVQNVYQRRADLVPNLVETVKGSANFEQSTLTAVV